MRSILTAKTMTWLERCERRVWLELHGDRSRQVADSPVSAQRAAAGLVHEANVMAAMLEPARLVEVPGWLALVQETLRLMREGATEIRQGGLEAQLDTHLRVCGRPDVLRRIEHASRLGQWSYEPIEIKQRSQATAHDLLQLDVYRWMLGIATGHVPDGELWLGAQHGVPTTILHQATPLYSLDQKLQRVCALRSAPEPAIWFAEHCQYCPWRAACSQQAEASQDIALLTKLDRRTAVALRTNGITTLSQITQLPAMHLARYPYAGPTIAPHLLVRAQALLAGEPIRATQPQAALAEPALLLDLESHPQSQVPWAFGWIDTDEHPGIVIVTPPRPAAAPKQLIISGVPVIFVTSPDEGWQHIAQLVRRKQGHIYHWGDHELHSLTKSASAAVTATLRSRLANLHEALAIRYTLPLPRLAGQTAGSLKTVGGYLGQEWPADVDWSISWFAYDTWRQQTSEAIFQRRSWDDRIDATLAPAIAYLHADLEALRRVWQWLKGREQEVHHA